jgi:uncharacterized protein YkwD
VNKIDPTSMMRSVLIPVALLAAVPAQAQNRGALVDLINAYRAVPENCQGEPAAPLAPLVQHPALAGVHIGPGHFLDEALKRSGYPVAQAEAILVSGAPDARSVMAAIANRYCTTLLSTKFSAVGTQRTGDDWQIVLARPAPPPLVLQLPTSRQAGKSILDAVNAARANGRNCGEQYFRPARALAWNGALSDAALAHSLDMARQRYFSHQGKDGRAVGDRAQKAGYRWRGVGENIAAGQETPAAVVSGWLDSPGHCANIMHPDFTEMGAGYAIDSARETPRAYWTQVFGTPR